MNLVTSMNVAHAIKTVSFGLFLTPFWERLWTMQEIALAPTILFHYGQEAFINEEILKLFAVCPRLSHWWFLEAEISNLDVLIAMISAWQRLQHFRPLRDWSFAEEPELSIARIVLFARPSQSKDPRDKVFGLLALLPKSIVERISPDYGPSLSL